MPESNICVGIYSFECEITISIYYKFWEILDFYILYFTLNISNLLIFLVGETKSL